jgi:drug/metabolite transporter (DMT)-like permease
VSLLVSLGVMWLTAVVRGVVIGAVCGLGAAFVVGAASTAGRRTERTSRGETNDNNSGLQGRRSGRSGPEQDDQQRSDPEERQR